MDKPRNRMATVLPLFLLAGLTVLPVFGRGPAETFFGLPQAHAQTVSLRAQTVFSGLNFPSAFAFAPDGRIFFTERLTGRIRIIQGSRLQARPFVTLPVVRLLETGLLGIAVHPDFRRQAFVYVYQTYRDPRGNVFNRVVRYRDTQGTGVSPKIIIDRIPAAFRHNGGKLAFGPDGKLYITTGDANVPARAQQLGSLGGKILRVNPDGTIPADNPFRGSPVWSRGHRNVFGLAFHPKTGQLFITENGPTTNDEVNIIRKGGNYGWPNLLGIVRRRGFIDPILTFTPNIAPTGIAFATGARVPGVIRNSPLMGDWNTGGIRWLALGGPGLTRVSSQRVVFRAGARGVLDIQAGPDGAVWFATPTNLRRLAGR